MVDSFDPQLLDWRAGAPPVAVQLNPCGGVEICLPHRPELYVPLPRHGLPAQSDELHTVAERTSMVHAGGAIIRHCAHRGHRVLRSCQSPLILFSAIAVLNAFNPTVAIES